MDKKNLHITIAATPNIELGNPKILEHDLRLTKASILYADRVKLCSMTAWMATSVHLIGNLPISIAQQFAIIMNFASTIASQNPNAINLPELQTLAPLLSHIRAITSKQRQSKSRKF